MDDKIFRRSTQAEKKKKPKRIEQNRTRSTCINFHLSMSERKLIESRIALSGLPKGQFFIESCMFQKILVKGNVKTFSLIRERMEEIASLIERNPRLEEMEPERVTELRTILEILDRLYGRRGKHGTENL